MSLHLINNTLLGIHYAVISKKIYFLHFCNHSVNILTVSLHYKNLTSCRHFIWTTTKYLQNELSVVGSSSINYFGQKTGMNLSYQSQLHPLLVKVCFRISLHSFIEVSTYVALGGLSIQSKDFRHLLLYLVCMRPLLRQGQLSCNHTLNIQLWRTLPVFTFGNIPMTLSQTIVKVSFFYKRIGVRDIVR